MKPQSFLVGLLAICVVPAFSAPAELARYNVVWDSPSLDAAGSMPIGNGEVVLNVWVEAATGDLRFYIARTDSLSEISRILKVGGVRVQIDGAPFKGGKGFAQTLRLSDASILVTNGRDSLKLFVDSGANVVHVTGSFAKPRNVTISAESWRRQIRPLPKSEMSSAWSVHDAPFPLVESADVFPNADTKAIVWYHRNETSIVPKLWQNQSLTGLAGLSDPIIHRTFGAKIEGSGLVKWDDSTLATRAPVREIAIRIATACAQTATVAEWRKLLESEAAKSPLAKATNRTRAWWDGFWSRSWVFVDGDAAASAVPANNFPLRKGLDSNGGNKFPGEIDKWTAYARPMSDSEVFSAMKGAQTPASVASDFSKGLTLIATIKPDQFTPGRIFDKLTAGTSDGFLFDTHPGRGLRLIVGNLTVSVPDCLELHEWQTVAAVFDPATGATRLYKDGKKVLDRPGEKGSMVTKGYVLQRFVQGCQGRGQYPIKFNGGYFTVEPTAMGRQSNPDYRSWGDAHWYQNVRHMYAPMPESGDTDLMEPFFRLYETNRKLAEARATAYHGAKGAYFPETMTVFGTYSGGDYGWNRKGLAPNEVQCPWWQYAWNQGPELVTVMLDRWDATRDEAFLKKRVIPMAESVLKYFDTRFKKDAHGRVILDPTQVVETYWSGVVNDMPSTSGLISVTERLCSLPQRLVPAQSRSFFAHMKSACPELPLQTVDGHRQLAPAQKYDNTTSNCENGELYAVWPFRVVSLAHPALLEEARRAYANRKNHLDVGWGYDGNIAALLGMTDEAARILSAKVRNSHPAYRWPATWGPNFDWLPDQNHGGNLLNTTQLMLLQSEPIEQGGSIRLLPAWPKAWNVRFKLHAPANTTVECQTKGGKIVFLKVTPASRRKDLILPRW